MKFNIPHPPAGIHQSLWPAFSGEADVSRTGKKVAKGALLVGSTGVSAAQGISGSTGYAIATGAAAASATGIGLVAVGGAMALGQSGLAIRSAIKTHSHLNALQNIYDRWKSLGCKCLTDGMMSDNRQHLMIAETVLPYIIHKKTGKFRRKCVTAVPVIGASETARAIGKKLYKKIRGTLGVNRGNAAKWLAVHSVTHNCALSQLIIADLWGSQNLSGLLELNSDQLAKHLAAKMKST